MPVRLEYCDECDRVFTHDLTKAYYHPRWKAHPICPKCAEIMGAEPVDIQANLLTHGQGTQENGK